MADISERIEKQMEGTNLALAAVAEVLQKMDGRLAKEAEDEEDAKIEEMQKKAQSDLVKSVAGEVVSMLKATESNSYAGADVSGDDRKASPTGGTPQNADDSETPADIPAKIEDQQNTIQAASVSKGDDEEDEEEKGGMAYKDGDDAEDEAADEPVEEKGMDDEDDDDSEGMKSMKKQLETLKKQIADTEANMQKAIQTESEERLRKMGFREETGLQAPKIVNGLGVDNTSVIQKAAMTDTPDQLAQLSYSELRRMQQQIESGDTDGVPRELLS